jgi:hypothetical protein
MTTTLCTAMGVSDPGNFWDDNNAMHGDFGGRTRTNVGRTKDNWYSKGLMGVSDPDFFADSKPLTLSNQLSSKGLGQKSARYTKIRAEYYIMTDTHRTNTGFLR